MIDRSVLLNLTRSPYVPAESRFHFKKTLSIGTPRLDVGHKVDIFSTERSETKIRFDPLVFDCQNRDALPGHYITSPMSSSDKVISFVASNLIQLNTFFQNCFGRNSIDNLGVSVLCSVHFGDYYSNAFWNGIGIVFGDGDGLIFRSMATSDDFIAHEFMHGVTEYSGPLTYSGEAGALNESFSDIFGSLFRQWKKSISVDQADWMIGSGLMGPTAISNGWFCLRSLKHPSGSFSLSKQPYHTDDFVVGGGPHDNSGIPNHAFYLFADRLGGYSWEKAGMIWYKSLGEIRNDQMKFVEFARLTIATARKLYPKDGQITNALKQSWGDVGVQV